MIKNVCCLLEKDYKILGVSRKDNPEDIGLPGGKIEPGESPIEAAKRELLEETGLVAEELGLIFSDQETLTYRVINWSGEITNKEDGVVIWTTWNVLKTGSFGDYNKTLERSIKLFKNISSIRGKRNA